jgi:hypothetical protein
MSHPLPCGRGPMLSIARRATAGGDSAYGRAGRKQRAGVGCAASVGRQLQLRLEQRPGGAPLVATDTVFHAEQPP